MYITYNNGNDIDIERSKQQKLAYDILTRKFNFLSHKLRCQLGLWAYGYTTSL